MLIQNKVLAIVFGIALGIGTPSAWAFGLGGLMHAESSARGGSTVEAGPAQAALLAKFVAGEEAILIAQSHLAAAYGLKKQGAILKVDAKALGSGATLTHVQDAVRHSESTNKLISKELAKGAKFAAGGRAQYIKSLPYYAIGVVDLKNLIPASRKFLTAAKQQISAAPFTKMMSIKKKLETGMFIAIHTPSYIKGIVKTSLKLVTYAKANHISIPKSATDALGG